MTNQPVSPARLYRIVVQVGPMAEAMRLYRDLLGIEPRAVHPVRAYFDCGGILLALVDRTADGGAPTPLPDHVYFAVADLEAIFERARRLGVLSHEPVHGAPGGAIATRPWGERSFYAVDPWGNRMCFVDERTVFSGA